MSTGVGRLYKQGGGLGPMVISVRSLVWELSALADNCYAQSHQLTTNLELAADSTNRLHKSHVLWFRQLLFGVSLKPSARSSHSVLVNHLRCRFKTKSRSLLFSSPLESLGKNCASPPDIHPTEKMSGHGQCLSFHTTTRRPNPVYFYWVEYLFMGG